MTIAFIKIESGDIVGDGKNKPYRELTVSYRKVKSESDIGLGLIKYISTGSKDIAIKEAKALAERFLKENIYSHLTINGCGKEDSGFFDIADDGKFHRIAK